MVLCLLFAAATFPLLAAEDSTVSTANSAATNSTEPQPYIRVTKPDTNTVQLDIALRKFIPVSGTGPAIWLAGTAHLGEPEYYHTLQKFLDAQTVVLFEGVNARAHPRKVPKPGASAEPEPDLPPEPKASEGTNTAYSLQPELAKSLGLAFQLDAIQYDRTNFLNSDLSIFDIQKLMLNDPKAVPAQPGQPGRSSATFDALLQIMDGSSFLGSIYKWMVQYIGRSPELQATTRLMFVQMLGDLTGDMAEMRGAPPELQHLLKVLIEKRNQNVVEDLKTELAIVPAEGSIAVFYGTGHMPDLEKRVVHQLHYRPVEDKWYTAFGADIRKTGMSAAQVQWLEKLIKAEMEMMK